MQGPTSFLKTESSENDGDVGVGVSVGRKFTIINKCSYTIWPAYTADVRGFPEDRGFQLNAGQSRVITLPAPSPGLRIWGRTGYDCAVFYLFFFFLLKDWAYCALRVDTSATVC